MGTQLQACSVVNMHPVIIGLYQPPQSQKYPGTIWGTPEANDCSQWLVFTQPQCIGAEREFSHMDMSCAVPFCLAASKWSLAYFIY